MNGKVSNHHKTHQTLNGTIENVFERKNNVFLFNSNKK